MAEATWLVARDVGGELGLGGARPQSWRGIVGLAVYVGVLVVIRAPELDQLRTGSAPRLRPAGDVQPPLGSRAVSKTLKKWWKYWSASSTATSSNGPTRRSSSSRRWPRRGAAPAAAEQAANVIANQKQSEMRLNAKLSELASSTPTLVRHS